MLKILARLGGEQTNRKILPAVFILLSLAMGCATLEHPKGAGKATPAITQSFASEEIRIGETWKIYLNASDPDGEMIRIYVTVEQPGFGSYPLSITRVGRENGKEFSGFLYLSPAPPATPLDGTTITLTVQIQDRSGNFSPPAIFPLIFKSRATQKVPPQGVFKERDLGAVMVSLRMSTGMQ